MNIKLATGNIVDTRHIWRKKNRLKAFTGTQAERSRIEEKSRLAVPIEGKVSTLGIGTSLHQGNACDPTGPVIGHARKLK